MPFVLNCRILIAVGTVGVCCRLVEVVGGWLVRLREGMGGLVGVGGGWELVDGMGAVVGVGSRGGGRLGEQVGQSQVGEY